MSFLKKSDVISEFIKLVENTQKEYQVSTDYVTLADKELQDIVHKAELEKLSQSEKAKLTTWLSRNRKDRRYWKNKVDENAPLYEYMQSSKEFKNVIEQLKQVLGKVRKAEKYLEERKYKPRINFRQGDE